jgi:hypothetical protein
MSGRRATLRVAMALALLAAFPTGAHAMFTGLQTVSARTAATSAAKSATVACPAGKRVIGAGGDIAGGDGQVSFDDIRPSSDLTTVTVRAAEDETGTTELWFVEAHAVCAPAPAGLVRVTATSPASSAAKVVTAACPSGKRALGTGAEVTGSSQVVIDGIKPGIDLENVTVNAFEDGTGTTASWSLTAYAICADAVPGLERQVRTTATDAEWFKLHDAPCASGKALVGVAGEINGGGGQVVMDALRPASETSAQLAAFEDDTGYAANWGLTTYAICAPVATRRSAHEGTNSEPKKLDVYCNAGMSAAGAGWDIQNAAGEAWFNSIGPGQSAGAALTGNAEDVSTRGWDATAFGICATTPAGYEVVSAPGAGEYDKYATATCPAGKAVIGAGATTAGSGSRMVQRIAPSADLKSATVAVSVPENAFATDWTLTGWAMCAAPLPGMQLVTRTSPSDGEELKLVTATCPAGKHLLGTGVSVGPIRGELVVDDLRPNADLTSVTATVLADSSGIAGDWSAQAQAICVSR